ncbi:serine/threonine protein phosphatase PrpC/predicted Ser/Thr protein kinase [Nitrobacteraceae bacterium AZCC 1564]
MAHNLTISIGQHSDKGRKDLNQDFHGALIPDEPLRSLKGISIVLADGISSSQVSQVAAESAVKSFLTDYYCTSDSWSVKTSAQRVIAATNSWLHAQTRRSRYAYERDKGYVCTFSAMVIKGVTAHIFHIGDCRIYRLGGQSLEQLTADHRVIVSPEESYLGRALGINPQVEIDYHAIPLKRGDVFVLATDGVYEHAADRFVAHTIGENADDLDQVARLIVEEAYERGSTDNLTVQVVRIDSLPLERDVESLNPSLPPPPLLSARENFDGYTIVRDIHASHRSHIYLATDVESSAAVALKIPSTDIREDLSHLRRFMMEEWIARRIDSPHVAKAFVPARDKRFLYVAMEFIEGQTLTQWMIDHPKRDLQTVRSIVEQIAKGLRAFHRREMLHQDLRPDNIMIDRSGTVKIVDFGSAKVAGVAESAVRPDADEILGTVQYTAPEYFVGAPVTARADMFSLGVIAYQLFTGKLPYGAQIARAGMRLNLTKLSYVSAAVENPDIPEWIDGALKKAVHPQADKRYDALSAFVHDLAHPNPDFLHSSRSALIERSPVLFWKCLSLILAFIIVVLLAIRSRT